MKTLTLDEMLAVEKAAGMSPFREKDDRPLKRYVVRRQTHLVRRLEVQIEVVAVSKAGAFRKAKQLLSAEDTAKAAGLKPGDYRGEDVFLCDCTSTMLNSGDDLTGHDMARIVEIYGGENPPSSQASPKETSQTEFVF